MFERVASSSFFFFTNRLAVTMQVKYDSEGTMAPPPTIGIKVLPIQSDDRSSDEEEEEEEVNEGSKWTPDPHFLAPDSSSFPLEYGVLVLTLRLKAKGKEGHQTASLVDGETKRDDSFPYF